MTKYTTKYVCGDCGYTSAQWLGKCPSCGKWNTFIEEIVKPTINRGIKKRGDYLERAKSFLLKDIKITEKTRTKTGIDEFDRVLGGGIVKGSVVLIGGEPGIGKSTLILQSVYNLAKKGIKIVYVSGEESPLQIKLRADRLKCSDQDIEILSETDIEQILTVFNPPFTNLVVIDSIQSIYHQDISSIPGSISQVRECGQRIMESAKTTGIPVFIIGHVTKGGMIAGPKTLEHLVDTVLYLEGDKNHFYRILRAAKNRFGSTNEIGVFEMESSGLKEVKDPSLMFMGIREENPSGTCTVCAMEGSRPFLVEIEALVAQASYGTPQRVSSGIDYRRVAMLLAVIERRLNIRMGIKDVFLNVVGGLFLEERAGDLGVILAIISSFKNRPIDKYTIALGEVGLTGEIRPVSQIDKRIKEATRLGFKKCIIPYYNRTGKTDISILKARTVKEAVNLVIGY